MLCFEAFILLCAIRFNRRKSLIKDIHTLSIAIEVEILKQMLKLIVFILEFGNEMLLPFLDLVFIDVEGQ